MKLNQVNTSALGEAIGVPTIGSKRISCVKFGYGLEGFDLDDTSTSFKHVHCDSCQDRKPRSSSWKWSFDWEKNKNHEYEALDGK
jgi:hypothetical protein